MGPALEATPTALVVSTMAPVDGSRAPEVESASTPLVESRRPLVELIVEVGACVERGALDAIVEGATVVKAGDADKGSSLGLVRLTDSMQRKYQHSQPGNAQV